MIIWKRTLRTASSERFVAVRETRDVALVDVHFLSNGTVMGTVVLFKRTSEAEGDGGAGDHWEEDQVPDLLASLDEQLLPGVDAAQGNLHYTVVLAESVGTYESQDELGG